MPQQCEAQHVAGKCGQCHAVGCSRKLNTDLLLFNCSVPNSTLNKQQQPFNGLFSRTTWVSRYQKGKTNLDFTEARDSEWQWHQLGRMQVCTSLQTDNHASNPPLSFLQAGCPSCRPTNSVKALKATPTLNTELTKMLISSYAMAVCHSARLALYQNCSTD